MRTTVTLDADVEQLLREEMRRKGKGFKEALNDALRRGLDSGGPGQSEGRPFQVESRPMRLRPGLDPARLGELDDDLEIAGSQPYASVGISRGLWVSSRWSVCFSGLEPVGLVAVNHQTLFMRKEISCGKSGYCRGKPKGRPKSMG